VKAIAPYPFPMPRRRSLRQGTIPSGNPTIRLSHHPALSHHPDRQSGTDHHPGNATIPPARELPARDCHTGDPPLWQSGKAELPASATTLTTDHHPISAPCDHRRVPGQPRPSRRSGTWPKLLMLLRGYPLVQGRGRAVASSRDFCCAAALVACPPGLLECSVWRHRKPLRRSVSCAI
jgi:hypothetical protein